MYNSHVLACLSANPNSMRLRFHSAKIARKEDEIERLRLEEEEKQERLRKAKQLKLREIKKN